MTNYEYWKISSDYWRTLGNRVEFQDKDGGWNDSIMPLDMFLDEAREFGQRVDAPQTAP